ncbi:hypothetical protein [Prevotellamassilia timonensis]|uniref:hypothetical protein n=1 Tax=Prevotellamassilia timonensis TaxID=1852370 RepID=UPI003FD6C383
MYKLYTISAPPPTPAPQSEQATQQAYPLIMPNEPAYYAHPSTMPNEPNMPIMPTPYHVYYAQ